MCRVIDFSEYFVWMIILLGASSLVVNLIETEEFDSVVGGLSSLVGGLSLWRIRKFAKAQSIMDSVTDLKKENLRLNESIGDLENQNYHLETNNNHLQTKIDDMSRLLGIFDQQNKTASEIQDDMISTMKNLEAENKKYTKLNKGHAFMIADQNHDGQLNREEQQILKTISSAEHLVEADTDKDNKISRKEYMTF